jgi:eukaryotic-like serine/threonine-protein kinase
MPALVHGQRLGPYEILSALGAGGMGEVYKARDTRLDRTVAIKVSAIEFSERFEREARAIAALNHPNICALYDVGPNYLVMEFIDGTPLKGPLPVETAIRYAGQICDALDAAHKKGIVHRDLKPANILITKSGIKLLDFGLAKLAAASAGVGDQTATIALTKEHTIMGTLQYMSPEQLQAKEADARSDIFSFGLVLYEMLTGKRAFEADSQASLIASVLKDQAPAPSSIARVSPASLDYIVSTCLAKNPDDRWQCARDLKRELLRPEAAVLPPAKPQRPAIWIAAAAVLFLAAVGIGTRHFTEKAAEPPVIRLSILPPPQTTFHSAQNAIGSGPVVISPDGRKLVFSAINRDGKNMLWIRSLDAAAAQSLADTDGAIYPFWSPDSRAIGFFAEGKLKRIDVAGGPTSTICDAVNGRGGTWNRDGIIVFAPSILTPLYQVRAAGGAPSPLTKLDQAAGETSHRWPWFLPDGEHYLYLARGGSGGNATTQIWVASLQSAERKRLVDADTDAAYANGYLLFMRNTTLFAQAFDLRQLQFTADAIAVTGNIRYGATASSGVFSVSDSGFLAYQTGGVEGGSRLIICDRAGAQTGVLGDAGEYAALELSPDGARLVTGISDSRTRTSDLWIHEVSRSLKVRFTFGARSRQGIWSPDGKRIVFNSYRNGHFDLYQKVSDGAGTEELLLQSNQDKYPSSWSPDGNYILFDTVPGQSDVWVLPMTGDRKPYPFIQTPFDERDARFSPDGRWVAYTSSESHRPEIYVVPFPGPGGKRQVSTNGGQRPRWRRDGKEIFYLNAGQMMAAEVNGKGASFEIGAVRSLFRVPTTNRPGYIYDVFPGGQKFVLNIAAEQSSGEPITLVQNWTAGLKR